MYVAILIPSRILWDSYCDNIHFTDEEIET